MNQIMTGERARIRDEYLHDMLTLFGDGSDSPLFQAKKIIVRNDVDYLRLLFLEHETRFIGVNWIGAGLRGTIPPDRARDGKEAASHIAKSMEGVIAKKRKGLAFEPRIERYLDQWKNPERENVKRLLVAYLFRLVDISGHGTGSLTNLLSDLGLPLDFILNLNDRHPLFSDGVLLFEEWKFNMQHGFLRRDLKDCYEILLLFAGIELDPESRNLIGDRKIGAFFGIEAPSSQEEESFSRDSKSNDETTYVHTDGAFTQEEIDALLHGIDFDDSKKKTSVSSGNIEKDDGSRILEFRPADGPGGSDGKGMGAYRFNDDLDYLLAHFRWIVPRIKSYAPRGGYSPDPSEDERRVLRREAEQFRERFDTALRNSRDAGFIPRLEELANRMELDTEDREILRIVASINVFSRVDNIDAQGMDTELTIKEILIILFDNPKARVRGKAHFLKSARLISSGILSLDSSLSWLEKSLFDYKVVIDTRILDFIMGDSFNPNEYLSGTAFRMPSFGLESVVIPQATKDKLLSLAEAHPHFLTRRGQLRFSIREETGNALIFLFTGPSGTGKTMLANALAGQLGKSILTYDSRGGENIFGHMESNTLGFLFREARISEAVLFFDESEKFIEGRNTALLAELDRHPGVVVFATNALVNIDEALRRRISQVVEFKEPGPRARRDIWNLHLPEGAEIDPNVDFEALARRYEINGGLIKNAVTCALSASIIEALRQGREQIQVTMDNLETAASEQIRNRLSMQALHESILPERGLDCLVLSPETESAVREIVDFGKALRVLDSDWGFSDTIRCRGGLAVLFYGPPGTGKTFAAEAVAYETGRALKVVNYAKVMSMWVGQTEKNMETLFREVANDDSILLFDEADAIFSSRNEVRSSQDRYLNTETDVLLGLIERYDVFCILTTNAVLNIDQAFMRRMKYIVEFSMPDRRLRKRLWELMRPPRMPVSADVDYDSLADTYDFSGADIRDSFVRAGASRALGNFEVENEVCMADFIKACEAISRRQVRKTRPIGFQQGM